jgi:hypothetical protein
MARGVYSHEIGDPDFEWLSTYLERCPRCIRVDQPGMPLTIISTDGLETLSPLKALYPEGQATGKRAGCQQTPKPSHEDKNSR